MNKKQSNSSINRQLKEMLHLQTEPVNREQINQICRRVEPLLEEKRKRRRINYSAFLKRQLRFIGWPIWLVQGIAMILLCIVFCGPLNFYLEDSVKGIAFLLCCLSVLVLLSSVPMIHRSIRYKMHELELSTRFSSVKLLLAKLLLIGIGNLVTLSATSSTDSCLWSVQRLLSDNPVSPTAVLTGTPIASRMMATSLLAKVSGKKIFRNSSACFRMPAACPSNFISTISPFVLFFLFIPHTSQYPYIGVIGFLYET